MEENLRPHIRLLTQKIEGMPDHLYGLLVSNYRWLPLADNTFDTQMGSVILIYKNHIPIHVPYDR